MELKDMIARRKSVRSYTGQPVEENTLERINAYMSQMKPLYPDIRVRGEIVTREQVKCFLPWVTPQLVAVYSEEKEGYLENVGFLFQQLDLYLQSIGLGVCWLGMGRMDAKGVASALADDLSFVILLAFGHPKGEAQRESLAQFKRKALTEISDQADPRLEPARLAPSSVNSQPWYFTHEGESIHAYCVRRGLFKAMALGDMNRIDMGIALAHLYVSNPETFRFFSVDAPKRKGYGYLGSLAL